MNRLQFRKAFIIVSRSASSEQETISMIAYQVFGYGRNSQFNAVNLYNNVKELLHFRYEALLSSGIHKRVSKNVHKFNMYGSNPKHTKNFLKMWRFADGK